MHTSLRIVTGSAAVLAALAIGAGPADAGSSPSLHDLRAVTARYQNVSVAEAEGFLDLDGECVQHMGIHYGNEQRFDGTINPLEPEVLLYVPSPGGMRLVGVEYVAVAPIGQPPTVFGQTLEQGPEVGDGLAVHSIHAYVWRHNPTGTFSAYNPKVSCPSATPHKVG